MPNRSTLPNRRASTVAGVANTLYYGDNLDVLRRHIATESVDLIYLDPPFNSNRSYNVLFKAQTGEASQAQIEASMTPGTGHSRLRPNMRP